jgi:hypothetical protein
MVTDAVWAAAGMPPHVVREYNAPGGAFLCVSCIEKRLGRALAPTDFPFNEPSPWDTPRLASRKAKRSADKEPRFDTKTVVNSLKVHFERGLEGEQLAERIRRDFPGISSADYVKAAETAWAQILAAGELQIKRIDDSKYSVWFVSGGYTVREWQGDEHWEAALFAIGFADKKYRGAKVFDQVTGELLANPGP